MLTNFVGEFLGFRILLLILYEIIADETIVQSNFDPFPSAVEGICEYLITLQQSRLSFELQDTIQDLEHKQSDLVTEVASSLNASLSEIAFLDDFKG